MALAERSALLNGFPDFVKPIGFQRISNFEEEFVDFLVLKTAT